MTGKPCIECGATKPLADYYKHPQMADGTLGVCKACHKRRMKVRRLTNPNVQQYDRERHQRPERKAASHANSDRWNKTNPAGYRAHTALSNAVRDKRILKEPCAICGATKNIHGHHKDYSKPLEVTWLCARCHHRIHATFPELSGHGARP